MDTTLTTEYVPTDRLRPHPDNPRRGDVAAIKQSLEVNGQYRPIVVHRPAMEVLAGATARVKPLATFRYVSDSRAR